MIDFDGEEDDTARPVKRFKSSKQRAEKGESVVLMRGFHWEGTYPSVITNSKGDVVLVSRALIDCPGAEYFFQWIFRKSASSHVCLLCPRGSPLAVFSTQLNKTSKIITHFKLIHKESICAYQHISDSIKSRVEKEWDFRLNNPDAPMKNIAQASEIAPLRR